MRAVRRLLFVLFTMGKLYFYYGAMNCGKTLQLLTKNYGFRQRGIHTLLLKSTVDTRDEGVIRSRFNNTSEPCLAVGKNTDVFCLVTKRISSGESPKWILVDEAQFLEPQQVDQLARVVDVFGISVMCFGLRTDFRTQLFPGSKRLFEVADSLEEIKTTCDCGNRASVNARIDKDGNIVTEGAQVEVGAEDKYVSLCRKCYNEKIAQ